MTYTRNDSIRALQRASAATATTDQLRATGVELPAELAAAVALVDALDTRHRDLPTVLDRRRATLEVLAHDPAADIAALVDTEARAQVEGNTLLQAADNARRRCVSVLTAHADTLTEAIRTDVFDPALAVLTTAATVAPHETPASLLRAGNTKAARALADVPVAADQLALAYSLRARFYVGSDLEQMACRTWREPPGFTVADHDKVLDYWTAGLRAGATMWLGTYTQVDTASRELDAKRKQLARTA